MLLKAQSKLLGSVLRFMTSAAPSRSIGGRPRANFGNPPHTSQPSRYRGGKIFVKPSDSQQQQKDGHYEGRTRDLGVTRMKAISTTL